MHDSEFLPPTLVYGCKKPEIRFRTYNGRQVFFCLNNANLHLTDDDLAYGTLQMGGLLLSLCHKHCLPNRNEHAPCPAFARSHMVGAENKGLASVEMYPVPEWERCGGVQKLLEVEMTEEERYFLLAYLNDHWTDEFPWRDGLVAQWNERWHRVSNGWGVGSRAGRFDQLIWRTVRFPALIPQVWLNWLHAAPDNLIRTLDGQASRVDFVAFAAGVRHVVELDGLSHYAIWHENTRSYSPDEREYARNLKIERWLRSEDWAVTRIGRWEVRDAMKDAVFGPLILMGVLPFGKEYPPEISARLIGCPEIEGVPVPAPSDLPF